MKFAKLGFKTKEGLSLGHYQDGWSMEYGEGGSYHCELLYKNVVVAELFEEGNGGPLNIWFKDATKEQEVDDAILKFLKRTDEDYGPNSQYELCRNITKATDCEYSCLASALLDEYSKRKDVLKYIKKGYKYVAIVEDKDLCGWRICSGNDEAKLRAYISGKGYTGTITVYNEETVKNKEI